VSLARCPPNKYQLKIRMVVGAITGMVGKILLGMERVCSCWPMFDWTLTSLAQSESTAGRL
jgi:hypothetical protein